MSKLEVDAIEPQSGTTLTIGASGDSVNIASGATITDFTSTGIDDNATSTAITIDSSENVLINTTDTDPTGNNTKGFVFLKDNEARFSEDGLVLDLNRIGSDGGIIHVRKDGTTYGKLGIYANDLYIGTTDTGLKFNDFGDYITPFNPDTNAERDNAIGLGTTSSRFTDLYLSDGVYLGGTAAANKLDDYEEGDWTPTVSTATGFSTGITNDYSQSKYTKIGNTVWVKCRFQLGNSSGNVTAGDNCTVSGLPFTPATQDHAINCQYRYNENNAIVTVTTAESSNLFCQVNYVRGTAPRNGGVVSINFNYRV